MPYVDVNSLDEKTMFPGILGKFVHSENMTIAFVTIAEGVEAPEHAHPHEQVLNLIDGEFELAVNGEKIVLKPGNSYVLPSNIAHAGKALKKCQIIDVFQPAREDLKKL